MSTRLDETPDPYRRAALAALVGVALMGLGVALWPRP